jgi:hypothetical protein
MSEFFFALGGLLLPASEHSSCALVLALLHYTAAHWLPFQQYDTTGWILYIRPLHYIALHSIS